MPKASSVLLLVCLFLVVLTSCAVCAQPEVVLPAAINLPYGGKIVTEINFSDDDVLGMIKQALPVVARTAKEITAAMAAQGDGPFGGMLPGMAMAGTMNIDPLLESLAGIHGVRLLVAQYPAKPDPAVFAQQFDAGVAKLGKFNRVVFDVGFSPGGMALYAAPDNGGFLGYAYEPRARAVYAMRIVGFVDVPKFTQWVADMAKMLLITGVRSEVEVPDAIEGAEPDEPSPEAPQPDAESAPQ